MTQELKDLLCDIATLNGHTPAEPADGRIICANCFLSIFSYGKERQSYWPPFWQCQDYNLANKEELDVAYSLATDFYEEYYNGN